MSTSLALSRDRPLHGRAPIWLFKRSSEVVTEISKAAAMFLTGETFPDAESPHRSGGTEIAA